MRARVAKARAGTPRIGAGVVALLMVGSLGLTGCSRGVSTARPPQAEPDQSSKTAAAAATRQAPDGVCDGAETLFAESKVQLGSWSPERQPFDPAAAAAVRNLAQGLAVKGRAPTTRPVRVQITANVEALNRLGIAMGDGKNPDRVLAVVRQMRVAYAGLTAACHPDARSSSRTTTTRPTRQSPALAAKPMRGATCQKVQDVMVRVGVELAAWSPDVHPFDEASAAKWRVFGAELLALVPRSGSTRIRAAIAANADAFAGIAVAMGSRDRDAVDDAVEQAGLAYLDIHRECSLA
jgi:hypothetical protein